MKKTIVVLALFLTLIIPVFAQEELFSSEQLDMELTMDSSIGIEQTGASEIEYIIADLYMFPKDSWRQKVTDEETFPTANKEGDRIRYEWKNVEEDKLNYQLKSRIVTQNAFRKVAKKVKFPFTVGEEEKPYLNPSETIDSDNPMIIKTASQIAEGQDDLFKLENELANYVKNNVEYNLTTSTAKVTQKASWTLQNKYGVCDEITTLFIAMNRAIGVPARFVSGVAYTNSPLFSDPWGSHAWAEVYFPEYGWVPFDITYEEFGYLDATHIEMLTTADAKQSSTKFEWKARNIQLQTQGDMNEDVKVIKATGTKEHDVEIEPFLMDEKVGFGSYDVVGARIKNLRSYYVPSTVYISRTEGLEAITENPVHIVLEPGEEKYTYWIINVTSDLSKSYIYTFPIAIYTKFNETNDINLTSEKRETEYSKEEAEKYYNLKKEEAQKTYSKSVDINCTAKQNYIYLGEPETARCSLKNSGNTILNDLQVCLNDCQTIDLPIGQEQKVSFEFVAENVSEIPIITAKNKDVSKVYNLPIEILDKPQAKITEIKYPVTVRYDDIYNISFTVEQASKSKIQNLTVKILSKRWNITELEGRQEFIFTMKGNNLKEGNNTIEMKTTYYDKKGRMYETSENIKMQLVDVTFLQKIKIWLNGIAQMFS